MCGSVGLSSVYGEHHWLRLFVDCLQIRLINRDTKAINNTMELLITFCVQSVGRRDSEPTCNSIPTHIRHNTLYTSTTTRHSFYLLHSPHTYQLHPHIRISYAHTLAIDSINIFIIIVGLQLKLWGIFNIHTHTSHTFICIQMYVGYIH